MKKNSNRNTDRCSECGKMDTDTCLFIVTLPPDVTKPTYYCRDCLVRVIETRESRIAERRGADKTDDDIQRSAEYDATTRTSVRRKQPRD
jgi:hypothetical protein